MNYRYLDEFRTPRGWHVERLSMPVTLTESEPSAQTPPEGAARKVQPDASQLEDRIPDWLRTTPRLTAYVALLGLLFTFFSLRPLWHTDLWGHLAYGRLIVETGSIPQTEPFMPLAKGVELVDTWWLSQVLGYAAYSAFGVAAIQFLYATAITTCLALLAWRFHAQTRSIGFAILGLTAFLWVEWQAFIVVRPQLAGLCCFIALLVWLARRHGTRADWFFVPILMALWVNLHGSFLLGPLLLGTLCFGRGFDVWRRTGKLRRAFRDGRVRRLFLLTELAAAAILLNPYGIDIYAAPFVISSHPNVADLIEWQPLTLRMRQGQAAFAVALLLVLVLRLSPRRIPSAEVLLLCGLGAAALWSSRMLVWWAPVAATSLVVHGHAVCRKWKRTTRDSEPLPRGLWTFVSIGLIWIFFGFSPLGLKLIHGVEPDREQALSSETPIRAAAYLREHPPRGLIFNPDQWGDYLAWTNPELPVFITTHAHVVPRTVFEDYLYIDAGWTASLDRYGVNTVVVNPARQDTLTRKLQSSPAWELVFADDRSAIFERKNSIGGRNP